MLRNSKIHQQVVNELFSAEPEGVSSFHDVVFGAISKAHTSEQLKQIFMGLPSGVQLLAVENGLSDTVFREAAYDTLSNKESSMKEELIYIVLKNGDFTEGRGPMLYHRTYASFEEADNYVMSKPGIYGSPQQRRDSLPVNGPSLVEHVDLTYNGYQIKSDVVHSGPTYEELLAKMNRDELFDRLAALRDLDSEESRSRIVLTLEALKTVITAEQ